MSVVFDSWSASWGDAWHLGTGGDSYVCSGNTWTCGGIRVRFDQPIRIRDFYSPAPLTPRNFYGFVSSASSGFEAWESTNVTSSTWWQPVVLSGLADAYTVQLNVRGSVGKIVATPSTDPPPFASQLTWIGPGAKALPELLRFMWTDYAHAAPLEGVVGGLPVGPFNLSIVAAA